MIDDYGQTVQEQSQPEASPAQRLEELIGRLHHQAKHNAPITSALLAELEAIKAEIV
jgi:hypothetical protein